MSVDQQRALRCAYRRAVIALPDMTRAIFLQHRIDGDDLATIAARAGISPEAAARHVADALVAINRALRRAGF